MAIWQRACAAQESGVTRPASSIISSKVSPHTRENAPQSPFTRRISAISVWASLNEFVHRTRHVHSPFEILRSVSSLTRKPRQRFADLKEVLHMPSDSRYSPSSFVWISLGGRFISPTIPRHTRSSRELTPVGPLTPRAQSTSCNKECEHGSTFSSAIFRGAPRDEY
jgi:hypothetical protein